MSDLSTHQVLTQKINSRYLLFYNKKLYFNYISLVRNHLAQHINYTVIQKNYILILNAWYTCYLRSRNKHCMSKAPSAALLRGEVWKTGVRFKSNAKINK